jgi:hypothetical protein
MKPKTNGYTDVNGINLYYEVYGSGEPLVLIHGGLTTIGEMQGWIRRPASAQQPAEQHPEGSSATGGLDRRPAKAS